jgi:serine/threonine protein kinase
MNEEKKHKYIDHGNEKPLVIDTFKKKLDNKPITNFDLFLPEISELIPKFIIDEYEIECDMTKQLTEHIKNTSLVTFFLKLKSKINNNDKYFLKISNHVYYKSKTKIYIPEMEIYELLVKERPDNIIIPIYFNVDDHFSISLSNYYEYDLYEYMNIHDKLSEIKAKYIYFQICTAVKYFHDKNIIIGDIKLENILINPNNSKIYFIDLETCYQLKDDNTFFHYLSHNGTIDYFSPEAIIFNIFGLENDIWSTGIILHVMLYGYPPTNKKHFMSIYNRKRKKYKDLNLVQQKDMSDDCYDLLKQILHCDVDKRINVNNILKHKWLL